MPMRCDTAPFDNADVRLAIKYAIDRQQILDNLLGGHGTLGNDHPIASTNAYFNADLPQRLYDPDRAKHHLKKAGLDSLKVTLSAADAAFPGAVDAAVLVSSSAANAGIEVTVDRAPSDGYWSDVWMNKPWCVAYWTARPTADTMFSIAYAATAPWNDTFWKNEQFNSLLLSARAELDDAKRKGMYGEMQQILSDDGGAVIPLFPNFLFATNDKIGHPETFSSAFDIDGNRSLERWWFKS
jgi:peptide/nickel transport system substrate-binding protein